MSLKLTPVTDSSVISGHHYDPDTRTLHIQTKSGSTYRYDDFPMEKAEAFAGNKSKGAYWNRTIQPHHKGVKVDLPKDRD